jgi:hypothetical protein
MSGTTMVGVFTRTREPGVIDTALLGRWAERFCSRREQGLSGARGLAQERNGIPDPAVFRNETGY